MFLYAGRISKGDIVVADFEELERMDASEIHTWRLNAKEVLTSKKGVFSRSQMEQSKFLEEISFREHPPKSGTTQTEEKNKKIL